MNFEKVVLLPLYRSFGVDGVLEVGSASSPLRVIDRTEGVEVGANSIAMPTVKAAAMCLASDVAALGYQPNSLIDGFLTFNGANWTIKSVMPVPGPNGRPTGELMLILINGDL